MILKEQTNSKHTWINIIVMSRSPENFRNKYPEFYGHSWLKFCKGDVMHLSSFPKSTQFTHLMHAATDSASRDKYTNLERHDQIVYGTRNALEYSVKNNIGRFLFISSGAVYGKNTQYDTLDEDLLIGANPLQSKNAYSVAKYEAEHLCTLYGEMYNIEYVVARCFTFIGSDLVHAPNFAIVNFISDALWSKEIVVKGDGLACRTYLYQDDLAYWLKVILIHGLSGQAYNVGSDEVVSISELAYLVRDLVSPGKLVRILGKQKERDVKIDRYIPNITKANFELGLNVEITLEDSIKKTAAIMKKNHLL
jgi:dTDP-glucose 4,6-dehydratase